MRRNESGVLLSASDLMRFAGCAHATTLDLAWMAGRGTAPAEDSEDAELLQRHGDAHEARHLARLRAAGRSVVEIDRKGTSLADGVAATRAALGRGAEVVFQGALAGGAWGGRTDFLERVERPSALGAWSYEVADTKLKGKPHPKHVLQLALYSEMLAALRGMPEHAHVELGDGTRATVCVVSMPASSIEEVPRGMGFLFSLNRINVAVSRAEALPLVFASLRLLDARCATVEEVRLVNTLCALPVAAPGPAILGEPA